MFYETERIVRKQQKYVKSKACAKISDLEKKGLSNDEIDACLDVMLKDDNNETQVDILNLAKRMINSRKETKDENISTSFIELHNIDGVFALHQDGNVRYSTATEEISPNN